jgi:hypothetical protein
MNTNSPPDIPRPENSHTDGNVIDAAAQIAEKNGWAYSIVREDGYISSTEGCPNSLGGTNVMDGDTATEATKSFLFYAIKKAIEGNGHESIVYERSCKCGSGTMEKRWSLIFGNKAKGVAYCYSGALTKNCDCKGK